jgi:hypothetical protein
MTRLTRRFVPGLLAAAALLALPAASAAAPRNDAYQGATPLSYFDTDDPADQTNVGATEQTSEPLTPSGVGVCGGTKMTHTVWYRVPGYGGPVTVETRGSNIDTNLAVYDTDGTRNGPPTFDNAIDCSTDVPGDTYDNRASEITFDTDDGLDYLVQIGNCSGCAVTPPRPAEGTVVLNVYDTPLNDARAEPASLSGGTPFSTDNIGATIESGEQTACGDAHYGKTVWFRYTAPGPGTAVFSASGSVFDSVLTVYQGSAVVGCNDDGGTNPGPSRLSLHVNAGTYLVQVGGYRFGGEASSDFARFTAQVEFTPEQIQPPAAPDRDGDGIPDASDHCPDQNARARDANGDGCLDPAPPSVLRSTVTSNWSAFARYTIVRTLTVNQLPAGATVKVTCRSKRKKRCPYRSRSFTVRKATSKLNLRKPFRKRRLPARTLITVQITAPGYVGKVVRYRMRKRKLPKVTQLCLQPGAKRPGRCS